MNAWIEVSQTLPDMYVDVVAEVESGLKRLARIGASGSWQFAEYRHENTQWNKIPPIEQPNNKVVRWKIIDLS